jgi:hypothetical protein
MPYFAAGLGEIPGRGRVVGTDGHGLAILDLNEPLAGGLPLRVGSPAVAHTLHHRGQYHDLSASMSHQRVLIRAARRPRIEVWRCGPGVSAGEPPTVPDRE